MIQGTLAHLPGFTLVAIFLPLLFQAASGLYLLRKHGLKYSVKKCNRGGKLRFFLQRATGLAILAFAAFHVGTLHAWGLHAVYQATHLTALSRYANGGLFQAGGAAFRSTVEGFGSFCGTSVASNVLVGGLEPVRSLGHCVSRRQWCLERRRCLEPAAYSGVQAALGGTSRLRLESCCSPPVQALGMRSR